MLSFRLKSCLARYVLSIASVCGFSFTVLPFPYLAVSTFTIPLFRSNHFSFNRSISIGRIPVSLRMLKIRLYFVPALAIRIEVSSVVGT